MKNIEINFEKISTKNVVKTALALCVGVSIFGGSLVHAAEINEQNNPNDFVVATSTPSVDHIVYEDGIEMSEEEYNDVMYSKVIASSRDDRVYFSTKDDYCKVTSDRIGEIEFSPLHLFSLLRSDTGKLEVDLKNNIKVAFDKKTGKEMTGYIYESRDKIVEEIHNKVPELKYDNIDYNITRICKLNASYNNNVVEFTPAIRSYIRFDDYDTEKFLGAYYREDALPTQFSFIATLDNYNGNSNVQVYQLNEDGTKTKVETTYENNQLKWKANGFGKYLIENPLDNVVESITKDDLNKAGNVEIQAKDKTSLAIAPNVFKQVETVGGKGLTIDLQNSTVTYDQKALASIIANTKDANKVEVKLTQEDVNKVGNDKQQKTIKDYNGLAVFDISLQVTKMDGSKFMIHSFDGGKATITVNYKNDKNLDLQVYRVEEDGSLVKMETSYEDGKLTWVTDGHSYYMVTEKTDMEKPIVPEQSKPNESNQATNTQVVTNNVPQTAASNMSGIWMMLIGMSLITMAGVVILRKKNSVQ